MSMPPPVIEPDFEDEEDDDEDPTDIRSFYGKIEQLGIGAYLEAIGAGLIAYREARQRKLKDEFDARRK